MGEARWFCLQSPAGAKGRGRSAVKQAARGEGIREGNKGHQAGVGQLAALSSPDKSPCVTAVSS